VTGTHTISEFTYEGECPKCSYDYEITRSETFQLQGTETYVERELTCPECGYTWEAPLRVRVAVEAEELRGALAPYVDERGEHCLSQGLFEILKVLGAYTVDQAASLHVDDFYNYYDHNYEVADSVIERVNDFLENWGYAVNYNVDYNGG
jgi:predicted RNA-binding Zn-ribbon protein involved in translation (DUF1610 family)